MFHPIYRVTQFATVEPYVLRVHFDDATAQIINFKPIMAGQVYGPLNELALFERVIIDEEIGTLVWPNGADVDPATLHDWDIYAETLAERARQWELATV